MANKWAIQNGNWSDGSTWNDGVVPTADDDVYLNGYTVTIITTLVEASKISNKICPVTQNGGGVIKRTNTGVLTINANIEGNGTTLLNIAKNYVGWTINGNCTQEGNAYLINGGSCVYNGNDFIINGNCTGYVLNCSLYETYSGSYACIYINGNYKGKLIIEDTNPPSSPDNSQTGVYINGSLELDTAASYIAGRGFTYIIGNFIDNGYSCQFGNLHIYTDTNFRAFPYVYRLIPEENIKIVIDTDDVILSSVDLQSYPQEDDVKVNVEYGMYRELKGRYTPTILTDEQLQRIANCATVSTVQKCFEDFKEE